MSFQPQKGTDDILPPESHRWREVLSAWEDWSSRYGYPSVETPVFEATELFERGVGEATEVVSKEMYTFTDRGDRSITLRPEGTAGIVRAYLNSGQQGVWKAAYSGPFFRYERPQAGRRRQFWQVGVEYLGSPSPLADVEVIELGYRYISAIGLEEITLLLNSIGDGSCRPGYIEELRTFLTERSSDLSEDARRLIEKNPLRVLDSKRDQAVVADAPKISDRLCDQCREHHGQVEEGLRSLGIPFRADPNLVRGLDYYGRTAFEYVATGLDAAQNAVGGGGRYDGLAEAIGGPATPGVGFALGVDRMILASGREPASLLDAYLVSEVGAESALEAVSRLRSAGLRVDFDVDGRSVKAQFRAARRLEAPVVLVWRGPEKPIDVQTEETRDEVPLEEVAEWIQRR